MNNINNNIPADMTLTEYRNDLLARLVVAKYNRDWTEANKLQTTLEAFDAELAEFNAL